MPFMWLKAEPPNGARKRMPTFPIFHVLVFHWKRGQEQPQAAQTFPSGARQIYPIHPKGLV